MKSYVFRSVSIFLIFFTFSYSSYSQEAVIVYTNNTYGFLQPCSCPGAPYGGLNRRETVLKVIRSETKDFFLLDAGNIFYSDRAMNNDEVVLEIYKHMNYDAINIGENEVGLGIEYLQGKSEFPFISSNLVSLEDKKNIFGSHLIIEKNGVKVGILGVLSKNIQGKPSIDILEPKEVLQREIRELKEKVDFIVVLSQLSFEENKSIASNTEGINLIIGGFDFRPQEEGIEIKNTILVQCGIKGHYVGKIKLSKKEKGKVINKLYTLDTTVPNDPEIQAIIDKHESEKADKRLSELQSRNKYMGSFYCKECHEKQYISWKTTKHAEAIQSLKKEGKEKVIDCLQCHTLGYVIEGDVGVQCEHCHKIPLNHDKIRREPVGVGRKICLKCHTVEQSPKFDYIEYLRQVIH